MAYLHQLSMSWFFQANKIVSKEIKKEGRNKESRKRYREAEMKELRKAGRQEGPSDEKNERTRKEGRQDEKERKINESKEGTNEQ